MSDAGDRDDALRAMLALDAGGMATWRWDVATNMVAGDDRLAALYGIAGGHWPIPLGAMTACIHPDDADGVDAAILRSIEGGEEYETEFRVRRNRAADADDPAAWRWLRGRGRSILGDDGVPAAMLGVNWDVTEQKLVSERMAAMATEMDHRVKNAFAVMRALVNIGRRRATDLDSFASDLGAQVQAMADAHAMSAQLSRGGGDRRTVVPVAEVAQVALGPWLAAHPDRVVASLDPRLSLPTTRVSGLSMLLQELVTNAAKHGALRPEGGVLRVTIEETRRGGASAARLVWNETCAAPLASAGGGATSGFGAVLMEHCLASLAATMERELRADGLKLAIILPVAGGAAPGA